MKFYKTLGLTLCCLLGLVACKKDNDVEISNIQYNMDKYEEKAISIAIDKYKKEIPIITEYYNFENAKIEELQILNINCTDVSINYLKYDISMLAVWSHGHDNKQYEKFCVSYTDIEVPIESEYIEEV